MHGINWENVPIDSLIELGQNTNIILKGTIKLNGVNDKFKLLTLKELYGENIFNIDSDLYIYGPNSVYIFGPDVILEGDSAQFETIIFSDTEGILLFNATPIETEREGTVINRNNGLLTTVENGLPTAAYKVNIVYVINNIRLIDDVNVTIEKRIYPTEVAIVGPSRISEEITTFTWSSPIENITGKYNVE